MYLGTFLMMQVGENTIKGDMGVKVKALFQGL
jgi:hypothetical protein